MLSGHHAQLVLAARNILLKRQLEPRINLSINYEINEKFYTRKELYHVY